jgi:hypothetical protein
MDIALGSKVFDRITGFEGIAVARVEYINGCVQYCVQPRVDKDGKVPDSQYLDDKRLEVVDAEVINITRLATGGPQGQATPPSIYHG